MGCQPQALEDESEMGPYRFRRAHWTWVDSKVDLSGRGRLRTAQAGQQAGLANTGWSENGHERASLQVQFQVLEQPLAVALEGQVPSLQP